MPCSVPPPTTGNFHQLFIISLLIIFKKSPWKEKVGNMEYKGLTKIEPEIEPKESKITNERQYWVSLFLEELNKSRKGKYKPLTGKFVAIKMAESGLKTTDDLRIFYEECKRSANFSKFWWWSFKGQ